MPPKSLFVLLFVMLAGPLLAQTSKVGYVDLALVYSRLPDSKRLKEQTDADKLKLQKDFQSQHLTLEQKAKAYQAVSLNADTTVRGKSRQQMLEVMQLSEQIRYQYSVAYEALQKKESQLQGAIEQKVKVTIEQVAQEQGYTSVLPLQQAYSYAPAANLTSAVLLKLGIK